MKLRKIEYEDNVKIVNWRNKKYVNDYFLDKRELTLEIHNEWYEKMILTGKVHQFIITQDDGREIGTTFLKNVDYENKKAEFGIFIGELYGYGKGYGTEATKLLCEYAFEQLKLHKVYLRVISSNERAIKSYIKSGFVVEGVFKDDIWDDSKFISVTFMAKFNNQGDQI